MLIRLRAINDKLFNDDDNDVPQLPPPLPIMETLGKSCAMGKKSSKSKV